MVGGILPEADGGLSQCHRADKGTDTQPAKPLKQKKYEENCSICHHCFDYRRSIC